METSENEKKEECKKGCCGSRCCCAKLFVAFVLLLLGGVIGYLVGKCSISGHCRGHGMGYQMMDKPCLMMGANAPALTEKAK